MNPARLLAWAVLCSILPKSANRSASLIYYSSRELEENYIFSKSTPVPAKKFLLGPLGSLGYIWMLSKRGNLGESDFTFYESASEVVCPTWPSQRTDSFLRQAQKSLTHLEARELEKGQPPLFFVLTSFYGAAATEYFIFWVQKVEPLPRTDFFGLLFVAGIGCVVLAFLEAL